MPFLSALEVVYDDALYKIDVYFTFILYFKHAYSSILIPNRATIIHIMYM